MSDSSRPPVPIRPKRSTQPSTQPSATVVSNLPPANNTTNTARRPEYSQSTSTYVSRTPLQNPPVRQLSGESSALASNNFSAVTDQLARKFEKETKFDKESLKSSGTPGVGRSMASTKSSSSSSLSANGEGSVVLSMKEPGSARSDHGQGHAYNEDVFSVLTGEEVKLVCKSVQFNCPFSDTLKGGTLSLTNYRLVFRTTSVVDSSSSFEIALSNIASIEKVNGSSGNRADNSFRLRIWCKDLRKVRVS